MVLFPSRKKTDQATCGITVIIIGNRHSSLSSNPGQDSLHFAEC